MLMYNPWIAKDDALNKAANSYASNKGIRPDLPPMKQTAGKFLGDGSPRGQVLRDIAARVPMLAERKLSPFQGLLAGDLDRRANQLGLHVTMKNRDEIRDNVDAAHRFEPLKVTEIDQLRDAVLAHNPTLCADCDGRCSRAAGTQAELGCLTRFLTYHEHLGNPVRRPTAVRSVSPPSRVTGPARDLEAARRRVSQPAQLRQAPSRGGNGTWPELTCWVNGRGAL